MAEVPPTKSADEKLRTVLDYIPCEACLAEPSPEQELLCSLCRRLDRQVAVKFVTRTSVILDRPAPAAAEMVAIPPAPEPAPAREAAAEPEPEVPALEVIFRRRSFLPTRRSSAAIEVIVEPYEDEPAPVPLAAVAPEAAPEPEEAPFEWEALASYSGPAEPVDDESVYSWGGTVEPRKPAAEPEPAPEPVHVAQPQPEPEPEPEPEVQDDFVFRPPTTSEGEAEPAEDEDGWMPAEEIPLEPPADRDPWAAPREPEEDTGGWRPPVEEEDVSFEVLEDEEETVEMEILEDEPEPEPEPVVAPEPEPPVAEPEPVVAEPEPEATPSEPTPARDGDLWRLPKFDEGAETSLSAIGIAALAHLSGHDPVELGSRTGLARDTLKTWIDVADFVQEAGIPLEGALTMVAAGIEGPGGLAALEVDQVVAQVEENGGAISGRDVKRWKRRV